MFMGAGVNWRKRMRRVGGALIAVGVYAGAAAADETVSIGSSSAVLLGPKSPRASIVLVPGGNGAIHPGPNGDIHGLTGNQLVRTRHAYAARGNAVLVVDAGANLAEAVEYMARIKRPVTVVATSRGTIRAAEGIAQGARPDALVLTSGFLTSASGSPTNVAAILGSPGKLPRTLVIHHRDDTCKVTQPAGVAPFIQWAAGRARVVWLSGGASVGDPCEAQAHHGFNGLDGHVVSLAASFR